MSEIHVYEAVLKGFDGGTDETDHLIKWIAAESIERATQYCYYKGWELQEELGEIEVEPCEYDGVDVFI